MLSVQGPLQVHFCTSGTHEGRVTPRRPLDHSRSGPTPQPRSLRVLSTGVTPGLRRPDWREEGCPNAASHCPQDARTMWINSKKLNCPRWREGERFPLFFVRTFSLENLSIVSYFPWLFEMYLFRSSDKSFLSFRNLQECLSPGSPISAREGPTLTKL